MIQVLVATGMSIRETLRPVCTVPAFGAAGGRRVETIATRFTAVAAASYPPDGFPATGVQQHNESTLAECRDAADTNGRRGTVRRWCIVRSGSVVILEMRAERVGNSGIHSDTIVPVIGCAFVQ
jgi:hypothetical protein